MPTYHPMPAEESGQQKVNATVPTEAFKRFRKYFPKHGSIQWAIRFAIEVLPDMIDRDEAYKEVFAAELDKMFAADRESRNATKYLSTDERQLGIFPTAITPPASADDDDGLYDFEDETT
jgi:hypothetical protein